MSAYGATIRLANSSILSPLNSSRVSGVSSMAKENSSKLVSCSINCRELHVIKELELRSLNGLKLTILEVQMDIKM